MKILKMLQIFTFLDIFKIFDLIIIIKLRISAFKNSYLNLYDYNLFKI